MEILADTNVPEAYVSVLRGDGHDVVYSRDISQLCPEATDAEITEYAESDGFAVLSTDISDFGNRKANIPVLVAPQDMSGGDVRAAVSRLETLPFDPANSEPIWLSGL
jgi:hypothetical protein